ncbi:hypothetical protein DICPUDRAFT_82283 [Dictyostelium purpureum]|uniref:Uncharacterized protein n=1 Tax=Dictyostelium purpureum TaxID=5786 RepID=F0ZW31_DICPU|nr:uncharacterized protein DICPUDRAFT_82283 [Dictyostelium purpureum]EGC31860.1 hypothetical protein DICPUDRAFT_82283 [Dictyostelium purpureum]|eukprot:XP_003291630.1 hypothetical protein DICPUDRAFT_82283 [Dictyostelium purpureum]
MKCNNNHNNNNNNNNNNNYYNDKLFFRVWRSIIIRKNIFYFLNSTSKNCSYNGTTNFREMAQNNNFEMILDKLKSNHFIYFDYSGSKLLHKLLNHNSNIYSNQINEIYKLLNQKNYFITNHYFNNFNNFSYLNFNNCGFNNNNNNNNNNDDNNTIVNNNKLINSKINQYYKLYTLIEIELKKLNNNIKKIQSFYKIIIKNYNDCLNNNNNYYYYNNKDNDLVQPKKKIKLNQNNIFKEKLNENDIKNQIYSNELVPIFTNLNLNSFLIPLTNEKVSFFQEELGIYIGPIMNNRNNKYFGGDIEIECLFNKKVLDECIDILLTDRENSISLIKYYTNNIQHATIFILSQIKRSRGLIYQPSYLKFIEYIKNNRNTLDLESLVSSGELYLISGVSNTKMSSRVLFFGNYYIYHCLLKENFKQIEVNVFNWITDSYINLSLILGFSVFKKSISSFKFFLKLFERKKIFYNTNDYFEDVVEETEMANQKSILYFDNIFLSNLEPEVISFIFKIIIVYHSSDYLEWLLNSSTQTKEKYHNFINTNFSTLLGYHLQQRDDINNKQPNDANVKKILVLFEHLFFKNQKVIDLDIPLAQIHQLFIQLLKKYNGENTVFKETQHCFIISLYKKTLHLDSNNLIDIYNQLNKLDNNNTIKQIINKTKYNGPNIFIKNILNSVINKDSNSIYKIINFLNNNSSSNNNNIKFGFIDDSFNYKLLFNNLVSIEKLSLKTFVKKSVKKGLVSRNNAMQLIESTTNIKLLKSFKKKNLIPIKFHLKDYFEENQTEYKLQQDSYEQLKTTLGDICNFKNKSQDWYQSLEYPFTYHSAPIGQLPVIQINAKGNEKEKEEEITFEELLKKGYDYLIDYIEKNGINQIKSIPSLDQFTLLRNISIEWFMRLYEPLIKYYFNDKTECLLILLVSHRNLEIFQFLWDHHLNSKEKKEKFLIYLFFNVFNWIESIPQTNQLIEYILKENQGYILNLNLDDQDIQIIHKIAILKAPLSVYKLIRSIFTEFKFKIDYDIFRLIIFIKYSNGRSFIDSYSRYDVVEYLYETNQIDNLKELIGQENLENKMVIQDFKDSDLTDYNSKEYPDGFIVVSKSMFILIHTIIKLQQ